MGVTNYCERRVRTKTGLPIESDFMFYQKICNLAWIAATKSYGTSEKIQERTSHGKHGLLVRCFDGPSHIPYAFVVRVENKIHFVNIAC